MTSYILVYIFVLFLGLCIGSFLNCVVYRLETKNSLAGRSFCPHCKHTLSWMDLFPVFSYLYLKGKCRYCKKKISVQYPLVELITAILFLVILNHFFPVNILGTVDLIFLLYVASCMIAIFVFDLKHYLIPDKILLPAIIITIIYRLFDIYSFFDYLSAALFASGFFLILFVMSKGKWMGFGDVKFAVLMGFLLGVQNVLVGLFIAFTLGAFIGGFLMILKKKGFKSEIPFAPFLVAGTLLSLLYGDQMVKFYLSLFYV